MPSGDKTGNNGSSIAQTHNVHTPGGRTNNPTEIINHLKDREKWNAIWYKNLSKAREIELRYSGKLKYKTSEDAVRAIVFKVCRLTNHDMVIIKEVLRRSKYDESVDYDESLLVNTRKRAIKKIGFEL